MNFKEIVESHPVIVIFLAVASGFGVGWTVPEVLRKNAMVDTVPHAELLRLQGLEAEREKLAVENSSLKSELEKRASADPNTSSQRAALKKQEAGARSNQSMIEGVSGEVHLNQHQ